MINLKGIVVYALFLPMVLQLLVPLLILAAYLIVEGPRRLFRLIILMRKSRQAAERRNVHRLHGDTVRAVIADDNGKVVGRVRDVSLSGICIAYLSGDLSRMDREVIFNGGGNMIFTLLLQPRWEKVQQSRRLVGSTILNNPVGWFEYLTASV